jgi:hypothetical protein
VKQRDVKLGGTYAAKVSERIVPVRLDRETTYGGWIATNLFTGREVRIRSAQRLRFEVEQSEGGDWGRVR